MKDKKTGAYIKKLRIKNNMSQEELASKLNVSRHTVSKWEQGLHINKEYFDGLSKIFKINPNLINYSGSKKRYFFYRIKNICNQNYIKLLVSFLIFLMCYSLFATVLFLTNYNTIKFYNVDIAYNNPYIDFENSYFFQSKEKVIFALNPVYKIEKDKINNVYLYYYDNEEKIYILKTQIKEYIFFTDYNGYNEYIDFDSMDAIKNNLFIELELQDGNKISCGLTFREEYSNNHIFAKKKMQITDNVNLDLPLKTDINEKIRNVSKKIADKYANNAIEIEYNKKKYQIYDNNNILNLYYRDENKDIILSYTDIDYELFDKNYYFENTTLGGYTYSITLNKCISSTGISNDCNDYDNDIDFFIEILNFVLEK